MKTSNPGKLQDEAALVKRAIKGDSEAYGILYVQHMDAIYRYIFFRIGEEIEAEDLTEEVFIKAWEALPKYQIGEYPFTSWLYRIAHNLIVDHHRKRKPETELDPDLHGNSDGRSHEDAMVRNQDITRLQAAIAELEPEEQQVLLLRFVEGLSHREVAAAIGKSEGASRIIQHRAVTALQKVLSKSK